MYGDWQHIAANCHSMKYTPTSTTLLYRPILQLVYNHQSTINLSLNCYYWTKLANITSAVAIMDTSVYPLCTFFQLIITLLAIMVCGCYGLWQFWVSADPTIVHLDKRNTNLLCQPFSNYVDIHMNMSTKYFTCGRRCLICSSTHRYN